MTCTIDHGVTNSIIRHQIEKGYLTLSVSSKMVKKAIKVFEAFLRKMFKEGFSLVLDYDAHYQCPASALVVDGEVIPIRLKEKLELKSIDHGSWNYKQYVPSGVLVLEIYGGSGRNVTKVLTETKDATWSEVFGRVIPYLHSTAKRVKKERLASEEWHRRWEEEHRIQEEHRRRIQERALAVKSIMQDVMLYEKAEIIRKYCDTAEMRTISDEYKERLVIARQIADWIDPTMDYVDTILSEKYQVFDFLKL